MTVAIALIFLAVGAALAVHLETRFHFLEYLFFCRFPLLLALLISVVLPLAILGFGENLVGNLVVLPPLEIALVSFAAVITAWVSMFLSAWLLAWIPAHVRLDFYRKGTSINIPDRSRKSPMRRTIASHIGSWPTRVVHWIYETTKGTADRVDLVRLSVYALLALPLIVLVVWASTVSNARATAEGLRPMALCQTVGAAMAGVLAAFGVRVLAARLVPRVVPRLLPLTRKIWFLRWIDMATEKAESTLDELKRAQPLDGPSFEVPSETVVADAKTIFSFFLCISTLYLIGYFVLHPSYALGGPSLALLLVVLVLAASFITGLAALIDKHRVAVVLSVFVLFLAAYLLLGVDHYYHIMDVENTVGTDMAGISPGEVLNRWRTTHDKDQYPTAVIVTASGGGITAARWTAEVLGRLQKASSRLADSVVLLSTASGGGVGALQFVDAFEDGRFPKDDEAIRTMRDGAATSSLLATAWGLAYRDFWTILPWMTRSKDRGWALETNWSRQLQNPHRTLGGWRDEVRTGWLPVQVFNATAADTGDRLLFTPMNLGRGPMDPKKPCDAASYAWNRQEPWQALNFLDLYPGTDIAATTAARLSATFPFVSPIARPEPGLVPECLAYHVADGGYYDNHGVITAIDFLRTIKPRLDGTRVVLVQIRAGSSGLRFAEPGQGFRFATIGPLDTILRVRNSTQVSRNDMELSMFDDGWLEHERIASWVFDLGDADVPLSWHLTESDVKRIANAWTSEHAASAKAIAKLLSP